MSNEIYYKSANNCYVADTDESNPLREFLELRVLVPGGSDTFYWINQAGNGCGDGYALEDIDGWSDADINERFRLLDLDVLRADAAAVREIGREDDADWLESWIDRAEQARDHNICVCLEHMGSDATDEDLEQFIAMLRAEGYTWAERSLDNEGDTSGITDAEFERIMDITFNR